MPKFWYHVWFKAGSQGAISDHAKDGGLTFHAKDHGKKSSLTTKS